MMPDVWKLVKSLEVEHRDLIRQNSDQNNGGRKEIEKQPYSEEIECQELRSRRNHH